MGKQDKSKGKAQKGGRPAPYKKPTVEVRYEGDSHKTTKQNNASANAKAAAAVSTKKADVSDTTTSAPAKSEKAKGKERADESTEISGSGKKNNTSALPGSFIMIAGSYEKLLYGIEGSYPQAEEQEDDGEVNRVVKPDLTPIFIFPAHLAFVKAIAASPGGKWLATGSEDEFIKVWDLRRRKEVGSLSQHTGSITSLHFPTSSHLLSTSVDGTISLFRTSDWSLLKSLKGHSGRVNYVDVHPTGRVALSVGKDMTLKMWDLMRGRGAASLPLGLEAEQVKFSPLGTHFAVLFPKKIEIYSLSIELLHVLETKSRFNSLLFAEVDLDGLPVELLCVGTEKGTVEVYDVDIVELEDEEDEEKEKEDKEEKEAASDEEDGEAEASAKPTQTAEVERIGTLIGHANRVKSISALSHTIPSNPPLATTLLTSVSSDGFINLYDLAQVFENTDLAEENNLEPVGRYDTKGSRLTCCFLADGRKGRLLSGAQKGSADAASATAPVEAPKAEDIADMDDAEDEDDEDEDMYDSAQEGGEDEDDEEEDEEEEEEEVEDEDEAEYE